MNIKKIIILLTVLLIIILITLVILIIYGKYEKKYEYDPQTNNIPIEVVSSLKKVNIRNNYYMVKSCVEKFYQYLTKTNINEYRIIDEETQEYEEKVKKQAIYDMLDEKYIQFKDITVDNIFEQIQLIEESTVIIEEMYVSQQDENMSGYIVYGKLRNNNTKENTDFQLLIEVDMLNRTFGVIMQDYITTNIGKIEEGSTLNFELEAAIEKNTYNTFNYKNITEETYITDIFNQYKDNMMNDYEKAYKKLDEEYSKKRFVTYQEFENYAKNRARESLEMQLSKYQVTNYEGYTQYTCIDENNNYYIFYVTDIMQYTVLLDTYTINLPQFTEKYNNASDSEKVLLNIQKIFSAINDGDYNYVYNKLDSTFKQNNFPTLESFSNYIKQNFYENNSIGYSNYQTSGNLHIYEISIKDKNNEANPTITKNFIMQLKDGTDFVMSFNV